MKYVKFYGSAGYCGTDYEEYAAYDDTVSLDTITQDSMDKAQLNGEGYSYLATQGFDEEDYETIEDFEEAYAEAEEWYWENSVEGAWHFVTEEEYKDNVE